MINKILINISIHFFVVYCIYIMSHIRHVYLYLSLDIRQDSYQDETYSIKVCKKLLRKL